jgi:hypothetical protein
MATDNGLPTDQIRAETERTIDALRKGVMDIRHTVEIAKDAVRDSHATLKKANDVIASLRSAFE